MKKIHIYLLALLGLLVSCDKDPIVSPSYVLVENEQVSATGSSLSIRCNIKSDVNIKEVDIECATHEYDLGYDNRQAMIKSGSSYTVKLTGLNENTDYYIRYRVRSDGSDIYTEAKKYRTAKKTSPIVTTLDPTNVTCTTATLGGNVTSDGGATVTERGVVLSTSPNPTIADEKFVHGEGVGTFSFKLFNSKEGTTYYIRAYAVNSIGVGYGQQKSFKTKKSVDGHGYVDLGLSVKWADCNIGANYSQNYGDYFAWGETETKSTYNWSTYKWCQGSETTMTKYCTSSSYGTVDNKTQLDLSDDAAHVNWGGSWRMPTYDEFEELRENCDWIYTSLGGKTGYVVVSKKNGNYIFLPAAGYGYDSNLYRAGSYGYYRSSSLYTDDPYRAWYVYFYSSNVDWFNDIRCSGLSVRPVCP